MVDTLTAILIGVGSAILGIVVTYFIVRSRLFGNAFTIETLENENEWLQDMKEDLLVKLDKANNDYSHVYDHYNELVYYQSQCQNVYSSFLNPNLLEQIHNLNIEDRSRCYSILKKIDEQCKYIFDYTKNGNQEMAKHCYKKLIVRVQALNIYLQNNTKKKDNGDFKIIIDSNDSTVRTARN